MTTATDTRIEELRFRLAGGLHEPGFVAEVERRAVRDGHHCHVHGGRRRFLRRC